MQTVQFLMYGEPNQVLEIRETSPPTVTAGQSLVRMTARPIHPADLLYIRGRYGLRAAFPSHVGFEGVGVVEQVGDGSTLTVGQRICLTQLGTWQEYVLVPDFVTMNIPDELDDLTAAQALINPVTAYGLLEALKLNPGDWLLQSAGNSTVGRIITLLAAQRGIQVIDIVRRDGWEETLLGLGAKAVINIEKNNLIGKVRELTHGKGLRAAVDAVGGTTGVQILDCLNTDSILILYGQLGAHPLQVHNLDVIYRNITLKGFFLPNWLKKLTPEEKEQTRSNVMALLLSGNNQLQVDSSYPLSEVKKAVVHSDSPGRKGKIMLV